MDGAVRAGMQLDDLTTIVPHYSLTTYCYLTTTSLPHCLTTSPPSYSQACSWTTMSGAVVYWFFFRKVSSKAVSVVVSP